MLDVWRSDVAAFLRSRGVAAIEDPANSNRAYWRVRVRRDLLVDLERDRPGIKSRLYRAAVRAAELQQAIDSQVDAAMASGMSRAALASMPKPVAAEALRTLYGRAAGVAPALDRTHLKAMLQLLDGGRGGRGVDLPRGYRFRVVGDRPEVLRQQPSLADISLQAITCAGCDDPAAAHLKEGLELSIGHRRPGLRMRPAHGAGSRKLQDIFVDARVPREERDTWPLVFAGEKLAWVPGIAVDRDLSARRGEPSLHVTVTRILSAGTQKTPMLESPHSPPGVPS
jgi:tRNA(Ile)-lysidine synthase